MSVQIRRGTTLKIITLEDNRDLQLFYKKILSMWGHETVQCLTLAEAQTALRDGAKPDLILADLTLPDATSEVLRTAFKGPEFAGIPLAITSGRDDLQSWGQQIGARQSFQKPVDIMQLKTFLQRLQGEKPAMPAQSRPPELH